MQRMRAREALHLQPDGSLKRLAKQAQRTRDRKRGGRTG